MDEAKNAKYAGEVGMYYFFTQSLIREEMGLGVLTNALKAGSSLRQL